MEEKQPEKDKEQKEEPSRAEENENPSNEPKEPEKAVESKEKVVQKLIEEEMKESYLDYSMSVIVGRALPDVRDGLKPVHRRILYSMNEESMFHNKPFKKCARVVGNVLGRYHPHGDTAVYDSLVRMAQSFSLRYPLIQGQGNFGSVDGDSAAAMRYTEARLSRIAEEMLVDIDKETVAFQPNFDGSLKEPCVLPAKIPNLLVNGSSGIAVGMATNIPPHNLKEVIRAVIELIDNQEISINELMQHIKGPDFPTAAMISGSAGIKQAYSTGRGRIRVKARAELEEYKDKERILITEIPYQVNKSTLLEQIASLVKNGVIKGISGLRDESDREGMRIIIELKKDANSQVVLNQLFHHTNLQVTFGINMLALVDNQPKVLNLKQLLQHFLSHRQKVVRARTNFELKKAQQRAHILEGIVIALKNIDDVVQKIKASPDAKSAHKMLMADYSLTDPQATAILDMKLQKLASMEQQKIKDEHKELLILISKLKEILASEKKILDIIKDELNELKEKYGDDRKTELIEVAEQQIDIEDLIKEEDMVVTITHSGYIKRLPIKTYKQQQRGGKGIIGAGTKEEDFIEHLFIASTHSYILFLTNKGQVHWLKVYEIPEASRQARGKAIVNFLEMGKEEIITTFIPVKEFREDLYLLLATKKGIIKKTSLDAYSRPRRGGIRAINLDEGDNLINAVLTDGSKQIILATKKGMAVKFHEKDARPIGRASRGVRGITLRPDDELIDMVIANDEKTLLTITENGYGKRTKISEYRLINRGGIGVKNIICSLRNGNVITVKSVSDDDEIIMISKSGIIIRTAAKGISTIGRNTQGLRLMRLGEGDKVVAAARIIND